MFRKPLKIHVDRSGPVLISRWSGHHSYSSDDIDKGRNALDCLGEQYDATPKPVLLDLRELTYIYSDSPQDIVCWAALVLMKHRRVRWAMLVIERDKSPLRHQVTKDYLTALKVDHFVDIFMEEPEAIAFLLSNDPTALERSSSASE